MSCENSVKVPVCGLELSLDTSNIEAGLSKDEAQIMIDEAISRVQAGSGSYLGKMEFTGFIKEELSEFLPGWHMMDGSFYANDTIQAKRLNAFPEGFKQRMGIMNDGEKTCLPSFFYEDGRGVFLRAGNNAGQVGDDTMRPITGFTGVSSTKYYPAEGAFYKDANTSFTGWGAGGKDKHLAFNSALLGVNYAGTETSPLHMELTPIIYLGV